MTLSPEVAALLRQALQEAHDLAGRQPHLAYQVLDEARAYKVLAQAIENLLPPLPEAEFAAHLTKYRRPDAEHDVAF